MTYILYGSRTSPFVRRILMVMEQLPVELRELNIFDPEGMKELNKVNPINQIPVLVDGYKTIWDSRNIFNYLNARHQFQTMDWQDENTLTAIEGALTSGVNQVLMRRSGMDLDEPLMFIERQKDRITSVLNYLRPYLQAEALKEWNFTTMTIYSFLDWAVFREILSLDQRPECQAFLKAHSERAIVQATSIPRT